VASIVFSNLSFTVQFFRGAGQNDGTYTFTASATLPVVIQPTDNGTLALSCAGCTITAGPTTSNDPDPNIALAQTDLIPALQQPGSECSLSDYLNSHLFNAVAIPAISVGGMNFQQTWEVRPGYDNVLMIYGALSQPVQLPSAGTAWPPNTWFAALDAAALSAVAASAFPLNRSGSWSGGEFIAGSVTADYTVQVSAPNLSPGTGNQISASNVGISGSASFCYHTPNLPWPAPSTPDIYGSASINGNLNLSGALTAKTDGSNQDIYFALSNVNINSLTLDGLSNEIFGGLTDALAGVISDAIPGIINGYWVKVATLSPQSLSISESTITIKAQDIEFSAITGPGGLLMSMITMVLATTLA
jgi:hypothetical protein